MKVLSFDISTSTIGYSVLDVDVDKKKVKLIKADYIKPPKKGSIFFRLITTKEKILGLLDEYSPDEVAIENIVQFMKNRSSAKTIISLAVFNRVIGLTIYEYLGKEPHLLNVNSIRSIIKPKDHVGRLLKEQIPDVLMEKFKIKFKTKFKKNGVDYAPETFDVSDGIAVGLAYVKRDFGVELE